MSNHLVRLSKETDAEYLAPRLRDADYAELIASGRPNALDALTLGHNLSTPCYSAVDENDNPLVMFGVVPDPTDTRFGFIWLLGSDAIASNKTEFLKRSREVLADIERNYMAVMNIVDVRNTVHIRWLKWCGFKIINTVYIGQNAFYEFVKINESYYEVK